MTPLLEARGLTKHFAVGRGLLGRGGGVVRAVDDIGFTIEPGRTLGVVGESGCGKTTTAKLVLRLEKPTAGQILFENEDVARLEGDDLRRYRKSVQAVFQDPYASLNPRMRVDAIIAEPLITHERLDAPAVAARVAGLPVSALDVSIRAQILNLLRDLQRELGLAYLFIAHDLAAVAHMSHVIAVMYLGRIVEIGDAAQVALAPQHPYTQALFAAALPAHPDERREDVVLAGEVPSPLNPPTGCRFHPRCPKVMAHCSQHEPKLKLTGGREVACHLY